MDLRRFIVYAEENFDLPILRDFIDAIPTAELLPINSDKALQSDEEEMGLTYGKKSDLTDLLKVLSLVLPTEKFSMDRGTIDIRSITKAT